MINRRTFRRMLFKLKLRLEPLSRPPLRQVAAVIVLVAFALTISWLAPRPAKTPNSSPAHVVTTSTAHPSEDAITTYRSTATGSQPKYLRLPTIKAEGYIQAVGVDQHHQIAVPTNIHLAGWFTQTVTPGNQGLSIIDGHLDGYHQPGIFTSLAKLKTGDHFSVELANGVTHQFQVETVQSLATDQAAGALFSQIPGTSRQLNLITCGGIFSQSAGYDHRVIVAASLIK